MDWYVPVSPQVNDTGRARPRLVLWVGPRHSGKTTAAGELVRLARRRGLAVAGVLAPAIRQAGELVGFEVEDIATGRRVELARRDRAGDLRAGRFAFSKEALAFGTSALLAGKDAALVVVDEFGPLELAGEGWRGAVDVLLGSSARVVMLVVREELAPAVESLYADFRPVMVPAAGSDAAERVLEMLRAP